MSDFKFEESAKVLGIVAAVSYALGIIISNGYLAGLGVMDFELIRPRAIFTGLWFILFLSVAVVTEDSIQRAFRLKDVPASWRLWNALFAFTGALFFTLFRFRSRGSGLATIWRK